MICHVLFENVNECCPFHTNIDEKLEVDLIRSHLLATSMLQKAVDQEDKPKVDTETEGKPKQKSKKVSFNACNRQFVCVRELTFDKQNNYSYLIHIID